ncbi:FkbM family methyltransferase [Spirosoma jeollabukense]
MQRVVYLQDSSIYSFSDNDLQTIDLLKMDFEGSEYDILYHTAPGLIRRVRQLAIEVHNLDDDRNNINAFNK